MVLQNSMQRLRQLRQLIEEKLGGSDAGPSPSAYVSLQQARELAIRYAQENTSFYGPRYSGRQLTWEVVSAEEAAGNHRIQISYRPFDSAQGSYIVERRHRIFVMSQGRLCFIPRILRFISQRCTSIVINDIL